MQHKYLRKIGRTLSSLWVEEGGEGWGEDVIERTDAGGNLGYDG